MFSVKGQPFFPVGGQVHNSSGYSAEAMGTAWKALGALGANTVEVPAYWDQIEPVEGSFNFDSVRAVVEAARGRRFHVVLLWFATWKNAEMKYAPSWVKRDVERFRRVHSAEGVVLPCLSSHCRANLEADKAAFSELVRYLREIDYEDNTLIGVQIENEPGILGSDRDYGEAGEQDWASPVPEELVQWLRDQEDSNVPAVQSWRQAGMRKGGTWPEIFGPCAGEYLSAWSIARYIDEIAVSGASIVLVYRISGHVEVGVFE